MCVFHTFVTCSLLVCPGFYDQLSLRHCCHAFVSFAFVTDFYSSSIYLFIESMAVSQCLPRVAMPSSSDYFKIVAFDFDFRMLDLFEDFSLNAEELFEYRMMVAYSTSTQYVYRFVLSSASDLYALMCEPVSYQWRLVHEGYRLSDFVIRIFYKIPILDFYEAYCYENDGYAASVYMRYPYAQAFVKYGACFPPGLAMIDWGEDLTIVTGPLGICPTRWCASFSSLPDFDITGDYVDHRDFAWRVVCIHPLECAWLLGRIRGVSDDDTPQWVRALRRLDPLAIHVSYTMR